MHNTYAACPAILRGYAEHTALKIVFRRMLRPELGLNLPKRLEFGTVPLT